MRDEQTPAPDTNQQAPAGKPKVTSFPGCFHEAWLFEERDGKMSFDEFHELVAVLIMAGFKVEFVAAHCFRVIAEPARLEEFKEKFEKNFPARFRREPVPDSAVLTLFVSTAPVSPRVTILHGRGDGLRALALALALRLRVRPIGVHRYEVTGSTACQIDWLSRFLKKSRQETLQVMQITEEQAAAEDRGPAPIEIALPDRRTTSIIDRDRDGNIAKVVQTETTPE
jgi:hypothetical protein